ncbi:hypothetical protein [Streptomyces sp. NPDC048252]|uniref:hypothetical protein n=1 Tax=Streptomyces sp. NPDC048252 TaxID=3154612 RepID=UPI0034460F52
MTWQAAERGRAATRRTAAPWRAAGAPIMGRTSRRAAALRVKWPRPSSSALACRIMAE